MSNFPYTCFYWPPEKPWWGSEQHINKDVRENGLTGVGWGLITNLIVSGVVGSPWPLMPDFGLCMYFIGFNLCTKLFYGLNFKGMTFSLVLSLCKQVWSRMAAPDPTKTNYACYSSAECMRILTNVCACWAKRITFGTTSQKK